MSSMDSSRWLLEVVHDRLETTPTLVDLVRHVNVAPVLCTTDYERFEACEYDAVPMIRALFCREFAGLL